MHVAILIIAVILVGGGIFVRNITTVESPPEKEAVLGETLATSTPTPVQSGPTSTPTPPAKQGLAPTETQSSSTNLGDFLYPNAAIGSQSDSSMTLTSTDDPQTITDWYKNKIKERGMSTRSFVQTKTNDNIHNVLAAAKNPASPAGGDDEIKVTITKKADEPYVSIVVGR